MPPKRGPAKSDREKAGLRGIVTKFIYNNQGDKIEERTTTSGNPLDAANASAASHAMGICLQIRWLRQLDPAGPGVQVTS
jgi:hypothetical protein